MASQHFLKVIIISNSFENFRSETIRKLVTGETDVDAMIIAGVGPYELEKHFVDEVESLGLVPPSARMYRHQSLSQLGCFYAHLKVLSIASKSDSATLILEDDAEFDPKQVLEIASLIPKLPADALIKLEGSVKKGKRVTMAHKSNIWPLGISFMPSSGFAAYLVTPESAGKLLDSYQGYDFHYDTYLTDIKRHGCFLVDAIPFPAFQCLNQISGIAKIRKLRNLHSSLFRVYSRTYRHLSRFLVVIILALRYKWLSVRFDRFNQK